MKPIHFKAEGEFTTAEMLTLIEKIGEFRTSKPYERISGDDCFGIRQKNGEILWCTVLGQGGMEFGISLFYGNEAINAFYDFVETHQNADVAPLRKMNGSYFNLHNKSELESCDIQRFKELGFTGYGRGKGWPFCRRYLPGHAPSEYLSKRDVTALTFVLTHLDSLIKSIQNAQIQWEDASGIEQWPVAEIGKSGEISWEYVDLDKDVEEESPVAIDAFMKKRLLKLPRDGVDGIFVGTPILFMPIASVTPPVLSEMMFFFNAENGMVLDHAVLASSGVPYAKQRVDRVIEFLVAQSCRPEDLFFENQSLANSFEQVFSGSSTEVDCIIPPEAYGEMLSEMAMLMNQR